MVITRFVMLALAFYQKELKDEIIALYLNLKIVYFKLDMFFLINILRFFIIIITTTKHFYYYETR